MTTFAFRTLIAAAACATYGMLQAQTASAQAPRFPDFDGDERPDFATSATRQSSPLATNLRGMVVPFYGNTSGGYDAGDPMFEDPSWPLHSGLNGDGAFGMAIAWGNFDGDRYTDLAVGAPYQGIGNANSVGVVYIFKGSASGLSEAPSQVLRRGLQSVEGLVQSGTRLGIELAVGDFDGDGFDDIAAKTGPDYGELVHVFRGADGGINPGHGDFILTVQSLMGPTGAIPNTGKAMATGDFDCDGKEDLAIANNSSLSSYNRFPYAGASVLYGPLTSGRRANAAFLTELETRDISLAAGNFNDGYNGRPCISLAIGVPRATVAGAASAGRVDIWGRSGNANFVMLNTVSQDGGIVGAPEAGDFFGYSVAMGSLDGDRFDDLIVGAPVENNSYGGFHVIQGRPEGVSSSSHDRWWHQDAVDIPGVCEAGDRVGEMMGATGNRTVLSGVPYEAIGNRARSGYLMYLRFKYRIWEDAYSGVAGAGTFELDGPAVGFDAAMSGRLEAESRFGSRVTIMRPAFKR